MIKTTWTCDKCGAVYESATNMWEIGVSLKRCRGDGIGQYQQPRIGPVAEWCRVCVVKAGLVTPAPAPKVAVEPTTLEDLVREIVAEEMEGGGS